MCCVYVDDGLQERHLSEVAQRVGSARRLATVSSDPVGGAASPAVSAASKPAPAATPASTAPVYPEDAALQAVRRFATRPPYQEFMVRPHSQPFNNLQYVTYFKITPMA